MQLWQMDVMGGVLLDDDTELKVVTGVDDHSRFCIAAGLVRATSKAVLIGPWTGSGPGCTAGTPVPKMWTVPTVGGNTCRQALAASPDRTEAIPTAEATITTARPATKARGARRFSALCGNNACPVARRVHDAHPTVDARGRPSRRGAREPISTVPQWIETTLCLERSAGRPYTRSGVNAMVAEIFGLDGAVVAVIAVAVLFGAKRLPEMARSIGRAQGELKKGVREGHAEDL